MDTHKPEGKTPGELASEVADEVEHDMERHDAERLRAEVNEKEDLNQGMQTGTHDAQKSGINWGPDYKIKKRAADKSD